MTKGRLVPKAKPSMIEVVQRYRDGSASTPRYFLTHKLGPISHSIEVDSKGTRKAPPAHVNASRYMRAALATRIAVALDTAERFARDGGIEFHLPRPPMTQKGGVLGEYLRKQLRPAWRDFIAATTNLRYEHLSSIDLSQRVLDAAIGMIDSQRVLAIKLEGHKPKIDYASLIELTNEPILEAYRLGRASRDLEISLAGHVTAVERETAISKGAKNATEVLKRKKASEWTPVLRLARKIRSENPKMGRSEIASLLLADNSIWPAIPGSIAPSKRSHSTVEAHLKAAERSGSLPRSTSYRPGIQTGAKSSRNKLQF